jgi:hypothetical protein
MLAVGDVAKRYVSMRRGVAGKELALVLIRITDVI